MTYSLILYADYVVTFVLLLPVYSISATGMFHILLFNAACFMAAFSHWRAMTTDPGAVPINPPAEESANPLPICRRCKSYKPRNAHHCSICKRCILKMDHHCPWVSNCVGAMNQKFFFLFLIYIFTSCAYALTITVTVFMKCAKEEFKSCGLADEEYWGGTSTIVCVSLLCLEAVIFGIFVTAMFFDQICNVKQQLTGIDRLKSKSASNRSTMAGLIEVCGERPSISWLLPVQRVYMSNYLPANIV